jgi:hypothetical protein
MLVRTGAIRVPEVEPGLLRDVFEKNRWCIGRGLGVGTLPAVKGYRGDDARDNEHQA